MREQLQVDRIRCDGHGLCAELLPEVIALDDWGYPIVKQRDVGRVSTMQAKRLRR
ncbi:MAG: ferredoxin [Chloroflexi bacterium]|nr:MAG: ferredoxin [Chloroflexota bacterium]